MHDNKGYDILWGIFYDFRASRTMITEWKMQVPSQEQPGVLGFIACVFIPKARFIHRPKCLLDGHIASETPSSHTFPTLELG